jgi:hypothetical protein
VASSFKRNSTVLNSTSLPSFPAGFGSCTAIPEGIITRSNDWLGALYEGPAFIAHSAAK